MKRISFCTVGLLALLTGIFTGCGGGGSSGSEDHENTPPSGHSDARYLRNLDDTVTDRITHLLWQDDSDSKTLKKSHDEAVAYCASLRLGGREDWRLPTLEEMMILASQGRMDTAFENVAPQLYHTQTPYRLKEDLQWYVNFNYGFDYLSRKSSPFHVRCVAGDPYMPHLERITQESVADTTGDLMWEDDAALKSTRRTWEEAKAYCENLSLDGYSDWRLPTIEELYSITDHTRANPAIKTPFQNGLSANFWSATPATEGYVWGVNFYQGSNYYNTDEYGWLEKNRRYYTRCVRSAPFNEAPTAQSQQITLQEDTPASITLSAEDRDKDPLTFTIVNPPQHGALTGTPPNLTYTPESDYHGPDVFSFRANDSTADSQIATVSLTIENVNDAPVPESLSKNTVRNETVSITLTAVDVDHDPLTYTIVRQPDHGVLTGTPPNLTYTPESDYNGTDSFDFIASDGIVDSNPATVTIAITWQNGQPSADDKSMTLDEDTNQTLTLTGSDPDDDPLTFVVSTPPEYGDYLLVGDKLTYIPNPNFHGTDLIVIRSFDGTFYSDPAIISITVNDINDIPVANDLSIQTDEDQSATIHLLASDDDNETLTYHYTTPSHGTLSGTAPDLIYTPNANYHGPDQFTYYAADPHDARSQDRTVAIFVTSVNDEPIADAGEDIVANFGAEVILDGTNSSDPDGTIEMYRWTEEGTELATTPTFTKSDFAIGTHTVTLTVTDNNGSIATDTLTVTINPSASFSFEKHMVLEEMQKPEGVYCADIDADGYDDILTADSGSGQNLWFPNNRDKSFTTTKAPINDDNPEGESIDAADIDGDGDIDILSGAYAVDGNPSLIWYENDGTDTFTAHPISISLSDAAFAKAADLDKDGDTDIITGVWNDDDTDGAIAWYENDGNENFTEHIVIRGKNHVGTVLCVDLDKDGDTDIVAALSGQGAVGWYENDGNENFTEHIIDASTPAVFGIAIGDFDQDAYPDIVSSTDTSGKIHWMRNNHDRTFEIHTLQVSGGDEYSHVESGDIDNDGDIDILYSNYYGGEIGWYRNEGDDTFTKIVIETGMTRPSALSTSDLDYDGDIDFAVALSGDKAFAWYENGLQSGPGYIPLPKTGITSSIASEDDGALQKGISHTYTRDENSGIVTDHTSGLMWEDDTTGNTDYWSGAESHCENLTLGGYDDWRIPNFHELYYLLDRRNSPAISSVFQNIPEADAGYWTEKLDFSNYIWVDFLESSSSIASIYMFPSKYIRCVRGEERKFFFKRDDATQIVSDYPHNLQWQDTDEIESNGRNWNEALLYCANLSLDGGGWRLPNINELYSTVDIHSSPALNAAFHYGSGEIYWSSSADGAGIVALDFGDGMDIIGETEENTHLIRCVRDIP